LIGTDEGWYEAVLVASDNFLPTRRHFKFVKPKACAAASADAAAVPGPWRARVIAPMAALNSCTGGKGIGGGV
jgi:hypothetical protein